MDIIQTGFIVFVVFSLFTMVIVVISFLSTMTRVMVQLNSQFDAHQEELPQPKAPLPVEVPEVPPAPSETEQWLGIEDFKPDHSKPIKVVVKEDEHGNIVEPEE